MSGIAGFIVAIVMAVWVYKVVNKDGGQLPWLWAAGALVFWPLALTIAGFVYDDFTMKVVGTIGLGLTVLGIVITIGFIGMVAFM